MQLVPFWLGEKKKIKSLSKLVRDSNCGVADIKMPELDIYELLWILLCHVDPMGEGFDGTSGHFCKNSSYSVAVCHEQSQIYATACSCGAFLSVSVVGECHLSLVLSN